MARTTYGLVERLQSGNLISKVYLRHPGRWKMHGKFLYIHEIRPKNAIGWHTNILVFALILEGLASILNSINHNFARRDLLFNFRQTFLFADTLNLLLLATLISEIEAPRKSGMVNWFREDEGNLIPSGFFHLLLRISSRMDQSPAH